MYENTPGMLDLVHHTVKHFLGDWERAEWDRVPAGARKASEAWSDVRTVARGATPGRGRFLATEWWSPPWVQHVRLAHEEGYRPRYELLINHVGDPSGARWQDASKRRRLVEHLGFRLVVEPKGQEYQAITAFYSPICAGAGRLTADLPALRAFASRRHCPPTAPTSVDGEESKS